MDLKIDNINLKTYLKPQIDLNIDNLYLTKENKELINLKDFSSSLQFGDILNKKIKLNHLLVDTIIIDLDDLINAVSKIETKEQMEIENKENRVEIEIEKEVEEKEDNQKDNHIENKTEIEEIEKNKIHKLWILNWIYIIQS